MKSGDQVVWTKWTRSGAIWKFKKFSGVVISACGSTTSVMPDGKSKPVRVLSSKLKLESEDTPLSLLDTAINVMMAETGK